MPFLKYRDESGSPRSLTLAEQDEVVIGRQSTCDVVLNRKVVSRRHCRCVRRGDQWVLEDLGSTAGTYLNRVRVEGEGKPLAGGDVIQAGDDSLTFEDGTPAIARAAVSLTPIGGSRRAPTGPDSFGSDEPTGNQEKATTPMQIPDMPGSEEIVAQSSVDAGDLMKAIREVRSIDVRQLGKPAGPKKAASGTDQLDSSDLVKLLRILDELRHCQTIPDVCRTAVQMAVNATHASRGVLALREPGTDTFTPAAQMGSDGSSVEEIRISSTFVDKVVRDKMARVVADAGLDHVLLEAKSIVAAQIRSVLAAPMWDGTEVLGYLYLDSTFGGRSLSQADCDLVNAIGHQAASDITRLRFQTKMIEEQNRRRNLARFLSADVITHIEEESRKGDFDVTLQAREQEVTILFADIQGFTAMSERMKAADMKLLLDDYFHRMTEILIDNHGGTLDKYIGDAVMALFGAPFSKGTSDDAGRAVAAAVEMRDVIAQLRLKRRVYSGMHMRIGINTGRVIAGMLGSERRLEYSVIGDAVNVASRLESQADADRILIGDATYQLVKDRFVCESGGDRQVKNRAESVKSWWVVGPR